MPGFIKRRSFAKATVFPVMTFNLPVWMQRSGIFNSKAVILSLACFALLVFSSLSHALPLAGGPHDRSSDPAYIASGINGICDECHLAHYAPEIVQYKRDLTPDATKFSQLCLDCHSGSAPPWASTAGDQSLSLTSLHDFSDRPIGQGGVCWPCHELHAPDPATASYAGTYFTDFLLWKRDITGELGQFEQKRKQMQTAISRPASHSLKMPIG